MKKIRVLIVDDSAVVRQVLSEIISTDPELEVFGTASDPFMAAKKLQKDIPDVITLDVEMPRMDGLSFLKKIMSQHPIPVVIISSLASTSTRTGVKALELGAVDIITKPQVNTKGFIEESKMRIRDTIKAAANAKLSRKKFVDSTYEPVAPKLSADAVLPPTRTLSMIETTEKVVAIGASTGGTEALTRYLMSIPLNSPGIVIVQHMPEKFTTSFSQRLNELCEITVKEAANNDTIIPGQALIAPGNYHMIVKRSGARYYVEVKQGPLVNRHRPSVDVLFRSTARYAGKNALGLIMTGMGDDGARGLLEMKTAGAKTCAQDEKSCVVFGMPKEAIKLNAADEILPLDQMASWTMKNCNR